MLQPGLDPSNCKNYKTCRLATCLTPEQIRIAEIRNQEIDQYYREYLEEYSRQKGFLA
jgi:hypothetical protein